MVDRIKRIPELRFSNFYNEWQEKKLGDLGKTYTGLSGKTKNDFGFGDSHFITYMNVFKNNIAKFEMTEKVKISNNEKQNKVNYGDIFFTTSSEVPQEVGMTSIWLFKTNNVYLNSFCFGFRITINNVLPIFLARYLRSENIRKKITILAQGSTRFNLSKKEVMKLSINFPEINEQQKIGDFFSKLDRQIELEEKKLELLEQQKRGYMQKIFSQELRFKDDNGNKYPNWETKKLSSIATIIRGLTYKPSDIRQNGVRVLRSSNILNDKFHIYKDDVFVDKNIVKIPLASEDDILITAANGSPKLVGKHALIKDLKQDSVAGGFMYLLKSEYAKFIQIWMNSKEYKKIITKVQGGNGSIGNLSRKDLENGIITIPCLEEQKKIGIFFSEIDKCFETLEQKIKILKQRKKGLLQKMFV